MTQFKEGDRVAVLHPATINGSSLSVHFGREVVGTIETLDTDAAYVMSEEAEIGQRVDLTCLRLETSEPDRPARIDLTMARGLLARAVMTQGPDFVYKPEGYVGACDYVPQTDGTADDPRSKTGCLVGVALSLHGIDVSSLRGDIGGLADEARVHLAEEAKHYFAEAQDLQDEGNTWGEAYAGAEEKAGLGTLGVYE